MTKYEYDKWGNMTKVQTAQLAATTSLPVADRFIKYQYHYDRPIKILFPPVGGGVNLSTVIYVYSDVAGSNKGRMIEQYDATGLQEFEYGEMGGVISTRRTIVFNSKRKGGTIDFWGLGWIGIFVVNYETEELLLNVFLEPQQEREKEQAFKELEQLL